VARQFLTGTKFCGGGKARAGREFIFPTPLFLPAPPDRKFSKVSVRIFAEKSSDFIQEIQHYTIFSFFRSVLRLAHSGLGAKKGQISETFFSPCWAIFILVCFFGFKMII